MKKLLLLSLTLFCLSATAQNVPCNFAGTFTATGDSIILDNTRLGCYQWRVAYTSTGFSAISISLQTSTTLTGSYSDYTGATVVTDGTNPATATTHALIGIHANGAFVKLHLGTATGSGTVIYQVWGANSTTTGYLNGISPIVVAGNTVSCPTCGTGTGTVSNIGTTAPITGGPITTTGTIACATCVTSAAALTNNNFVFGAGSQASQTVTAATATAALNLFSSTLQGLAPLSGGGTTNFLRADGTWAAPPGGGGVVNLGADIPVGGAQTLSSGATTQITYTTAVADDGGFSGVTANALVIPTGKGGWYTVSSFVEFSSTNMPAGTLIGLNINQNGTSVSRWQFTTGNVAGTAFSAIPTARVIKLSDGDTVTSSVFQNSGVSLTVVAGNLSLAYVN